MKSWMLLLGICFAGIVSAVSQDVLDMEAKRQARSVHLGHKLPPAKAVYGEVTVRESVSGTYFCAIGFDGGYFGIQEQGGGRKVAIFSVWDPGDAFDFSAHPDEVDEQMRTKVLYSGENVRIRRFGGEGTGGQSMMDFDWKVGETYRFAVASSKDGDHRIAFTAWIYLNEAKKWFKMASFSTIAVKGNPTVRGVYSFVEDFRRDYKSAKEMRRADFTNFHAFHGGEKRWFTSERAQFTGDRNPVMTVDAGPLNNGFFLQTGGETKNVTVPLWQEMTTLDASLRAAIVPELP